MKEYEDFDKIEKILENSEYTIEDYKKILNKLEDEHSKLVLYYRIMLDNTDDAYYGINLQLVSYKNNSVNSFEDREMYNFHNFLLEDENYKKKIYQIGIPENGMLPRLATWQGWERQNVVCVFDDVEEEYLLDATGGVNIEVKKLNEIENYIFDEECIFIIAHPYYEYMKEYLINNKQVDVEKIFLFREEPSGEKNNQYFCESFFPVTENEIYMDCGTYDFNSIFDFIYWSHGNYKKIIAIEPIKEIYDTYKSIINENQIENIEIYNVGLWNEKTMLSFKKSEFGDSKIDKEGEITLSVDSVDNILNGKPATFIKYDIEGAESQALEGTKETIKNYKPKLCVSGYHKRNDVIKLIKQVLEYNEKYKVYIRHYGHSIFETNIYFIEI